MESWRPLRDYLLCGTGDHRGDRRRDGTSSSVDRVRSGAGNGLCLLGVSLPAVLRKAIPAKMASPSRKKRTPFCPILEVES